MAFISRSIIPRLRHSVLTKTWALRVCVEWLLLPVHHVLCSIWTPTQPSHLSLIYPPPRTAQIHLAQCSILPVTPSTPLPWYPILFCLFLHFSRQGTFPPLKRIFQINARETQTKPLWALVSITTLFGQHNQGCYTTPSRFCISPPRFLGAWARVYGLAGGTGCSSFIVWFTDRPAELVSCIRTRTATIPWYGLKGSFYVGLCVCVCVCPKIGGGRLF